MGGSSLLFCLVHMLYFFNKMVYSMENQNKNG